MIEFDIIIVSNASNKGNKGVTDKCISSLLESQKDGFVFKPIIVEQNKSVEYDNALTLHYDFDFNYNKCLNYGLSHSVAKFKGLCNNDIIFHENWHRGIYKALIKGFGSVSPYCPNTHKKLFKSGDKVLIGYTIGHHLAGWAIFLTDETLERIGIINEGVDFWYSDNIYGEQLKYHGIKHGIVCNSFVTHIGSVTLKQNNSLFVRDKTVGQRKKYEQQRRAIETRKMEKFFSKKAKIKEDRDGFTHGEETFVELKKESNGKKEKNYLPIRRNLQAR